MTCTQNAEVFYEALCFLSVFYLIPNLKIQAKTMGVLGGGILH